MQDRRTIRSEVPSEALTLMLESWRTHLDVRTLVVITPAGDLLGSAGPDPVDVAASTLDALEGNAIPALATWQLHAGGRTLVVGSLGGRLDVEIGDGVRRILAP